MKRYLSLLLILLGISVSAMAQTRSPQGQQRASHQQQLSELTNRYISSFGLTGEKAEQFRTIFLAYNKQLQTIKRQYQSPHVENPTEEQREAEMLVRFNRQRAILDARLAYYHKFRTVLRPSQIQQIYDDEKARKEQVLKHG